jgi:hypothetical protein
MLYTLRLCVAHVDGCLTSNTNHTLHAIQNRRIKGIFYYFFAWFNRWLLVKYVGMQFICVINSKDVQHTPYYPRLWDHQ